MCSLTLISSQSFLSPSSVTLLRVRARDQGEPLVQEVPAGGDAQRHSLLRTASLSVWRYSSAQSSSVLCMLVSSIFFCVVHLSLLSLSSLSLSSSVLCIFVNLHSSPDLPPCLRLSLLACHHAALAYTKPYSPCARRPLYVCMYIHIYIYTYIHIYVCIYIYMCVCVCVYIFIFIHKWHTYINGKNVRGGAQAS